LAITAQFRQSFCTPIHRFSQLQREISIDVKNQGNYLHARLNRGRNRFAAQFIEGAKSLMADAPSFFSTVHVAIDLV
jgi:hypothetical protein